MPIGMTHSSDEDPANLETLERVAERLRMRGFEAHVVLTFPAALPIVLDFIPTDAHVLTAASETLRQSGLAELINDSGRFEALRPRFAGLEADERRLLASTADVVVGSVQAITETGRVVCSSATGSQLAAYVYGAQRVIWLVGAQKIVPDLDSAFRRIEDHCLPLENERAKRIYGRESLIAKTLILDVEPEPGRTCVILVGEALGF